jgi:hypothetical protein
MDLRETIIKEIEKTPDFILSEIWDYLNFLRAKHQQEKIEVSILSEAALAQDWLSPEEEQAWQDL